MDRVPTSSSTPRLGPSRIGGFLLLPLCLLPLDSLSGQTPSDRVLDFLDDASGFSLLGSIHKGVLESGQNMAIAVPLVEGADYLIVAYCDSRCTNLDLVLFDSAGVEVQADRLPDAEPVLMLTAESTGQYYIQVSVVQCPTEGCDVAAGILGSSEEPGMVPGADMAGRLTLLGSELMSIGFSESEQDRRGSLGNEQAIKLPVSLQEGTEYRLVGVCDQDCFDMDLALFHPRGDQVASDFLDDAFPIMAHVPDTTAEYQVEVIMRACGVEPCGFRVVTYARETPGRAGGITFSGELVFQETYRGELDSRDPYLRDVHVDVFEVEAKAGQRIIADLRSAEFDTLLRVIGPDGSLEENDDFGYDTSHSHIEMLALADGTYSVHVTSFTVDSLGPYVLQIAIVE